MALPASVLQIVELERFIIIWYFGDSGKKL